MYPTVHLYTRIIEEIYVNRRNPYRVTFHRIENVSQAQNILDIVDLEQHFILYYRKRKGSLLLDKYSLRVLYSYPVNINGKDTQLIASSQVRMGDIYRQFLKFD